MNNPPDPHPKPKRRWIRCGIAISIGILVCGSISYAVALYAVASTWGGGIGEFMENNCGVSERQQVKYLGQFKLPPSAKLLLPTCGVKQGWGVAGAHFEMLPADLDTFLATTGIKPPLSTNTDLDKLYCFCEEQIKSTTTYLYGTYELGVDWFEEVFIDTSNPTRYIVYFTILGR